jgi:PKD repeat protein
LEYRVKVSVGGMYTLRVRGASRWGEPSLSLLVDGVPAVTVPIYINESYDEFALTNATVNLPEGEHRLRLALSGYFNLDYIEFEALSSVLRLPGAASDPRDLDGDGRYEDVNGNGRRDFADVVLYFNQMAWIASNAPVGAFDFNANGRCDFADVTTLFGAL